MPRATETHGVSAPGFNLLFQARPLGAAMSLLGTEAEVLAQGLCTGLAALLLAEADGGSPEDAPAFARTA